MDISVIIPVYNTEPYLHDCIKSVIASECFPRCEVLLVNDGSTDGSEAILRAYEKEYVNIHYLDYGCPPWNRGGSAARNLGIEQAQGDYLFLLDSDDAIQPGYLETLYLAARERKCEIVYAGLSRWSDDVIEPMSRLVLNSSIVIRGREFLNRRMDARDNQNYAVCALYCASLFREKGLRYDCSVLLYEDILFSWRAAIKAERVSTVPVYGYLYRVRSGSLVQDGVRLRDLTDITLVLEQMVKEPPSRERDRFCFMIISMYLYYMGVLSENGVLSRKEQLAYYGRLSALDILPALRKSAATRTERIKWLLWRINWKLFYPLVKKG